MNQLQQIFNYQDQEIRTILKDGQPWFVAKDLCEVLEIKNNRDALSRLDEDEKGVVLTDTLGGSQELAAVNEPGLYALILSSRKPEAKQFKRWITHDVIPTIRQTGQYGGPKALTEREQRIESLKLLLETSQRQDEMSKKLSTHEKKILELNTKVDEQITIDHGEQRRIQKAVATRIYSFTDDKNERNRLFKELYREIKDRFGVSSYKDVKRKDMQLAVNYIVNWVPRRVS
ncbi:prophage antirepressor [Bacillus stratosphericus LAMA 585]|uniref:BRO family protein n=1 Tax=Bacillus safensis TaxID=561879 RepID=UPI0002BDF142|nr:BRO family protein [Bacillus safensis]EMI14720.1 prophage antirepressor [Bacillus stratosphericus LAMA 585]GLF88702.1 antirepressor [Bacillus safensis]GLF91093.1 antirepressor [Bacillus safensis]